MTLQKGIQIGQALMGLGQNIASAVKKGEDAKFQSEVDEHFAGLMKGEPQEGELPAQAEGPEAAGPAIDQPKRQIEVKNPKALAAAYTKWYQHKLQDREFRAGELKQQDELAQRKRNETEELWVQYNGLLKEGKSAEADEIAIMMYNKFPNGDTLQYDRNTGKVYKTKDRNGTIVRGEETEMPSREQIETVMQDMLTKEKFNQSYIAQYRANKASNIEALSKSKRVVDKDGEFVGFMAEMVDPETGMVDWQYSDNQSEGTIPWNQAKQDGLRLEDKALDVEKKKADIEEQKSKTKHRGIQSKRLDKAAEAKDKPKESPELIRARDYVATGQFDDLQIAMAEVRTERSKSERIRMATTLMENVRGSDPNAVAKREQIQRAFGVTAEDINPTRTIGRARRAATAAKTESRRAGEGVQKAVKTEETVKNQKADIKKWLSEGKTKAEVKKLLTDKYSK